VSAVRRHFFLLPFAFFLLHSLDKCQPTPPKCPRFSDFLSTVAGSLGLLLFFLAQLIALLMIPFGLPGTFLQVVAALALVVATDGVRMSWPWVGVFLGFALLGELIEFLSGQWGAKRFGGSKKAAWGAIIGGLAGVFLGGLIPIPVVGSLVMSFFGTFAGAIAGEMHNRNSTSPDLRIGFGAILGRACGVAVKLFIALLIAILSAIVVINNLPQS
jgi:hypothetical protein